MGLGRAQRLHFAGSSLLGHILIFTPVTREGSRLYVYDLTMVKGEKGYKGKPLTTFLI